MEPDNWIVLAASGILGGGGLVAWFRAKNEAPKLQAETQSIIIRDLTTENTRLKNELAALHLQLTDALAQINQLRDRVLVLESRETR